MARIRIGTSGWHYKSWKAVFYPAKLGTGQMLEYYSKYFTSAEVNNSFYKLPEASVFENWYRTTPDDFLFSVKMSRYLTHMKKLKDPKSSMDLFFSRAAALKEKLGPVLVQLPPNWRCNLTRLQDFLEVLPRKQKFTIEFRDTSWITPETLRLLKKHHVAFCIYDLGGYLSPLEVTAPWVYVRLHGPQLKYQGNYPGHDLKAWAERLQDWLRQGLDTYLYFDNDQKGAAIQDAIVLTEILEGSGVRAA